MANRGGGEGNINLDLMDPRLITFQTVDAAEVNPLLNPGRLLVTATRYDSRIFLFAPVELNQERLQRGWGLVYSKYCSGKRKPF